MLKKSRWTKWCGGLLFSCGLLAFGFAQTAEATSTADKLNQVEQQKKQNENKLDQTSESSCDLKGERAGLQEYLLNL